MKSKKYLKYLSYILATIIPVILVFRVVYAAEDFKYTLLDKSIFGDNAPPTITDWNTYITLFIKAFYTFLASAAVFMITFSGIEYMLSEIPNVKSNARERITNALIGLILALSTYLILKTINPELLNDYFSNSIKNLK
jgi:hypothetical protein